MLVRCPLAVAGTASAASLCGAADGKPLTPVEARKKVGPKVTVQMEVKTATRRSANARPHG